jgi:molybdate transport system regulatory protein
MGPGLNMAMTLERAGESRVGAGRIALIEAIDRLGSIRAAAGALGLSYKGAWDGVQALNNLAARPLVETAAGGRSGGAAKVTVAGRRLATAFRQAEAALEAAAVRLGDSLEGSPNLFWSLGMRTSARNALRGEVTAVTDGAVNAEVQVRLVDGVTVTAIVTRQSVEDLGLAVGRPAIALIDSSAIILAQGEVRTSARNRVPGTVQGREDGAVSTEILIDIGGGKTLAATITLASAEELGLQPGSPVTALIKAPHIILAVE